MNYMTIPFQKVPKTHVYLEPIIEKENNMTDIVNSEDGLIGSVEINTEPILDHKTGEAEEKIKVPLQTDKEWGDYVMSQFAEDELFEGNPNVDGLTRVTELLIGEIVGSKSTVKQSPVYDNSGKMQPAVVEHEITILPYNSNTTRIYCGVADCFPENTEATYARFPTAMASTRAKGRALRDALRLKKVAAEELTTLDVSTFTGEGNVTKDQLNFINVICQRNDINPTKFINMGAKTYKQLKDISRETASKMVAELSRLQSNYTEISDKIKGYDENWQKTFEQNF